VGTLLGNYDSILLAFYKGMDSRLPKEDLMAVLDGVSDAVVKLDFEAKYVAMNKAAEVTFKRLGKDSQSIIGKSVWEVFPELKGSSVEREIVRALEDDVWISFEFFYPAEQRWYQTNGYPSSPGVILVFRDITDTKASS
jgi:PAS domain S-box-containing protein